MTNLSEAAKKALINANRGKGSTLPKGTPPAVVAELVGKGLIGTRTGLTVSGQTARQSALDEAMEF